MRTCNRIVAVLNPPPKAQRRGCVATNCRGHAAPDSDYCPYHRDGLDRLLDAIDREHPELHVREPDPPGQVSDPNLLAALSMSILSLQMDAERERDEAVEGGRR